jgi:GR25 family glycosyltransferase involved in LPS biosynthesis
LERQSTVTQPQTKGPKRRLATARQNVKPRRENIAAWSMKTTGLGQIHLINLDRSTDRLAAFQKRNAHLSDLVRFSAVDGQLLDKEKLINERVITHDCRYTTGNLASAMSHIGLWKLAVHEERAITIAEDDAIFSHHFHARSKELLAGLSEGWDIVMWGFSFGSFVWVDLLPQIATAKIELYQDQSQQNIGHFQDAEINPTLMRLRHLFGTPCYSVTPKGARALLDYCLPLSAALIDFPGFGVRVWNDGLDFIMNGAYPSLNAFVCMPPLVVVESGTAGAVK